MWCAIKSAGYLPYFIAHKEAYLKVGILHRDISDNNVMIDDNGRGILTDWELAIRVKARDGNFLELGPRQRYRTVGRTDRL